MRVEPHYNTLYGQLAAVFARPAKDKDRGAELKADPRTARVPGKASTSTGRLKASQAQHPRCLLAIIVASLSPTTVRFHYYG